MSIFVCLRPVVNRPHSLAFDEMADSGVNSLSVCSLSSLRSFARLPLSHSWTHESEPHFVWLIASVSDFHWKSIPVVLPRKSSWLLTSLDVLLFCFVMILIWKIIISGETLTLFLVRHQMVGKMWIVWKQHRCLKS